MGHAVILLEYSFSILMNVVSCFLTVCSQYFSMSLVIYIYSHSISLWKKKTRLVCVSCYWETANSTIFETFPWWEMHSYYKALTAKTPFISIFTCPYRIPHFISRYRVFLLFNRNTYSESVLLAWCIIETWQVLVNQFFLQTRECINNRSRGETAVRAPALKNEFIPAVIKQCFIDLMSESNFQPFF